MDPDTGTFERLRPRLQGIAYRMLGARAEAEEVVQDTWLRWREADPAQLDSAEAWLVSVATRLAIDRLRRARVEREHYIGIWLPEPLVEDSPPTPHDLVERADAVSYAFLAVLERLTPEARAAWLLREVFEADYAEVAQALGRSEAACRQIVHRAKAQLRDARPRHRVPPAAQQRLLRSFAQAASQGDFAALKALLAEEAQLVGDGGGKVPSFGVPLHGGTRIAQLFLAACLRHRGAVHLELTRVNGQWGLLRFIDGVLESVLAVETDGHRILRIHAQRNPDKLAHVIAQRAVTNAGAGTS
ncbi:MAG: RNA polymerase sigma-70 factor [Piscinibacter sp.]|nr:RNA polymerase sigma-70 factor [Piscinibacter sp.]